MKEEDIEFWKYLLLENTDFLLRRQQAQGKAFEVNIDELVKETINHVSTTLNREISDKTEELVYAILHEKCIGDNLWKIKEKYVIPTYYLADIFLIKANELFCEEERRFKSVLSLDELTEVVIEHLNASISERIDDTTRSNLHKLLEKLCSENKYFKKVQNTYIIFDKHGRDRLEKITANP